MIVFPNNKINLGLHVLEKRADGFHNIETVFYPVAWCDVLEALPAQHFFFETHGLPVEGTVEDNLCVKAFLLLQREHNIPNVKMCLLKNIPMGAGLGGGSSDAAFTLTLLNELFALGLSVNQLMQYAARLGSDCSFFVEHKPCIGSGKGDVLTATDVDLSSFHIMIVYPPIHINTAWAYSTLQSEKPKLQAPQNSIREIISKPVSEWRDVLKNDFEEVVFKQHPEIAAIKNQLFEMGAVYASMSGSGSAVYGIFTAAPPPGRFGRYQSFTGKL